MKKLCLLALFAVYGLAAPGFCESSLPFIVQVLGPENPQNLWQFATCRFWVASRSNQAFSGMNHGRLVWDENAGYWGMAEDACRTWSLGSGDSAVTLIAVAEYTEGVNTAAQRAFYAAASSLPGGSPSPAPMREVPQAGAFVQGTTVTVTWTAVPGQPEVAGYRVVRSPNGLAGWVEIGTTVQTSFQDTRNNGTWYYAAEILYAGTPVQRSSPHGLSAMVAI